MGSAAAIRSALELVVPGGELVIVGMPAAVKRGEAIRNVIAMRPL